MKGPISVFATASLFLAIQMAGAQTPTVEFRVRERFNDTVVWSGDGPPTASALAAGTATDRTVWFVVEARAVGGPADLKGIGGFSGNVRIISGAGGGAFKVSDASNASPSGGPGTLAFADAPAFPLSSVGQRGIYEPFRSEAPGTPFFTGAVGSDAIIGISGSVGGQALGLLIDGAATPAQFGRSAWVPVYTFQYDVNNLAGRQLVFLADFEAYAFSQWSAEAGQPATPIPLAANTRDGAYTLQVNGPPAPACPADFDASGQVALPDLFAFITAMFAGAPAADFNGSGGAPDIADLFAFLASWFAGCP